MTTNAQQTILNVPSVDVLEKGKVYVDLDAAFNTNDQEMLRTFSNFVPRVVGEGGNVEIGLNALGNVQPGADSTTFVPAVKWRFYQNEKKRVAHVFGNKFYVPIKNKSYNFGTYTYAAVGKTINKTRQTAGAFVYSKNVVASKAARGGGQFRFE